MPDSKYDPHDRIPDVPSGPHAERLGYVPSPTDERDAKTLVANLTPWLQPRAGNYFNPVMLPPKLWKLNLPGVLNQGQTPKCTSRAAAHGMDSMLPIAHAFGDAWADDFYNREKLIDGLPPGSDGSTPRALGQTLVDLGLIPGYAWAQSIAEVRAWVLTKGPCFLGTIWTRQMSKPQNGWVLPFGVVDGGHEIAVLGWIPRSSKHIFFDEVILPNSWGQDWGGFFCDDFAVQLPGYFRMKAWALWWLMHAAGEMVVAVENPNAPALARP